MSAFDKVIAYEDEKKELLCYSDMIKNYEKYEALGVSFPRGIMIFGEPGLGKTTLAKCFIEECGCPSFIIRKDKPDGEFVDHIKEVFEKAKNEEKAIVLLDDIDKYANEDYKHCDAEEYVAVQACIDGCADSRVFVIMTVNDSCFLPDSLKRSGRICRTLEIHSPNKEQREEIIRYYLSTKKIDKDVDPKDVLRLINGGSCADLEEIINDAGLLAGYKDRDRINRDDILQACIRKRFQSSEFRRNTNPKMLRRIAVHEAGHAIVAEVLDPGSVNMLSVYAGSEDGGGVTTVEWSSENKGSLEYFQNDIMCNLGGKAAIELVYGVADVGCRRDMSASYEILHRLVVACAFGFSAYEDNYGEYEKEEIHRTKAREMEKLYDRTRKLIADNRQLLDRMVEAICKNITLTYREIGKIKADLLAKDEDHLL